MNITSPNVDLAEIARAARRRVVTMSHEAKTPHLGSCLSCIDLLVALYWSNLGLSSDDLQSENRNRCILSKGHASAALYAVLAERGILYEQLIGRYARDGAELAEQMGPHCAPGIEVATGSLGHGLPISAGLALAARIRKWSNRVTVVMSDGECNEGSVWEAALFAGSKKLHRLTAVIDCNGWQATGRTELVLDLAPLGEKWEAFGWSASEVDGHDMEELLASLNAAQQEQERPSVILARTVKGKGVSFMEDDNNWHYRIPDDGEFAAAMEQLVTCLG